MCRVEIEISNPRNDLADRNLGKPRFRSARSFLGLETSISTRHTYKILILLHGVFDPSPDLSPSRLYQPEPEGRGLIRSEG